MGAEAPDVGILTLPGDSSIVMIDKPPPDNYDGSSDEPAVSDRSDETPEKVGDSVPTPKKSGEHVLYTTTSEESIPAPAEPTEQAPA